jgi:protein-S-isoprenylcysteine O-methyltransferase Ste14
MKYYQKWANRKYSLRFRLLALLPAGLLFVFLIPYTLIVPVPRLDRLWQLPSLSFGMINLVAGVALMIVGTIYGYRSISSQLFEAHGTPIPVLSTQKLLVSGVFSQCRNPMTFGTICMYLGISILVGSIASIALVLIFAAVLLLYIKIFEERELEMRFGQEYRVYKNNTPFLIPRISKKRQPKLHSS